jgi:type II secretory pathway component PulF
MAFIITPRQLAQRSELYHQLASLVTAGTGLIHALELVLENRTTRLFHRPLTLLISRLKHGATFAESLKSLGNWLPAFDIALLEAGESSGRLDTAFRLLAEYYNERARLARSVLSDLAYPLVTLHVALLVFPPTLLSKLVWDGAVWAFVSQKLGVFGPFYISVLLLCYAAQSHHSESWRSAIERFLRAIPVLGTARRSLALARLSAALEGLLSAGVSVIEAWQLAADSSGSPALRRAVRGWVSSIEAGQPPSEMIRSSPEFPDVFASLYSTGEVSGKLDDALRRLYQYYNEEATRKLRALAQWSPRLIYFGMMLFIGYYVVSFWMGYYSGIMSAFE